MHYLCPAVTMLLLLWAPQSSASLFSSRHVYSRTANPTAGLFGGPGDIRWTTSTKFLQDSLPEQGAYASALQHHTLFPQTSPLTAWYLYALRRILMNCCACVSDSKSGVFRSVGVASAATFRYSPSWIWHYVFICSVQC